MKLPAWLWPIRTGKTFFDVWSICHFVAGMLIGFNVGSQGVELPIFIGINLALGYGWEVVDPGRTTRENNRGEQLAKGGEPGLYSDRSHAMRTSR